MNIKKFIITVLILVILIGLVWLGFVAVKMIDKWIGRKAKADVAQKMFGGITGILPVRPPIGK